MMAQNTWSRIFIGTLFIMVASASAFTSVAADNAESFDAQKMFDEALAQRERGELQEAIKGFQAILSRQPDLHRARLELAVAYFQALNYDAAIRQAQQVMDDPKTPDQVKENIRRFLARVEAVKPEHKWKAHIALGPMYDSNVNVGPSNVIDALFVPEAVARDDYAIFFNAGITDRYITGRNVKMGNSDAAFMWLSEANYLRIDYFDEDEFDLDVLTAGTGPAFISLRKWRTNIDLRMDYIRLGSDSYGLFAGLFPNFTWILDDQRTEVSVDALLQRRDYRRSVEEAAGRDSDYRAIGMGVGHLFPQLKVSLQGGVRFFDEDADTARFTNDGHEVFLGANWRQLENTNVYGRVEYRESKYDGSEPTAPGILRDEKQYRYVLGFNHKLKSVGLKGWVLKGNATFTRNESNVSLFDYDRDQVYLTLERSFE